MRKLLSCLCGLATVGWLHADTRFESNIVHKASVARGGRLFLDADRGSIALERQESQEVEVQITRSVEASSQEEANKVFVDHEITFEQKNGEVRLVAKAIDPDARNSTTSPAKKPSFFARLFGSRKDASVQTSERVNNSMRVRYRVLLPEEISVELRTAGGNIDVPALKGAVRATTSDGGVTVGAVSGPVTAKTYGGNIHLLGSQHDVEASTSAGNLEVGKVGGRAELKTYGGAVSVEEVEGPLVISTSSGEVKIGRAGDTVEAKTYGGNIRLGSAHGKTEVTTSSGDVRLGHIEGDVLAKTYGGDVEIEAVDGSLEAATSAGRVNVGRVQGHLSVKTYGGSVKAGEVGGPLDVMTSAGSITLDHVTGAVHAKSYGGDIQAKLRGALESESLLETSSGHIALEVGDNVGFNLKARSNGGRVRVNLPNTQLETEVSRGSVNAEVGGGGPELTARASGGDVSIKALVATKK